MATYSKVLRKGFFGWEDCLSIASSVITTGWQPGQLACIDPYSEGYAFLTTTASGAVGVILDSPAELSAPPSGSKVTVLYGTGKIFINHKDLVDASDSTRAYESNVESAMANYDLYVSTNAKWTTVASGARVGTICQIPTAANNYELGILLRI
jgi:hypothetical protein